MNGITNMRELAEIVDKAMTKFNEGMQRHQDVVEQERQLSIRIGIRTTQIVRFSMLAVLILGMAMFFLAYILMNDMHNIDKRMSEMTEHIGSMQVHFTNVAENTREIKVAVVSISEELPIIRQSMLNMDSYMVGMRDDMKSMNTSMEGILVHISAMRQDMDNMSAQFMGVNQRLGAMGNNVRRMASPLGMFPFSE